MMQEAKQIKDTPAGAESVHIYDGKLFKVPIPERTIEEKKVLFELFMIRISSLKVERSIIDNLVMIMNDTRKPQNYLATDNIYADDILAEIIDIMMKKTDTDVMTVLFEELLDMTTGRCSSGRCVRLYQIFLALRNN
jgi:hypothetical protein